MSYFMNLRQPADQEIVFPCADRALYNAWFNLWFLNDAGSNGDRGGTCSNRPKR